MNAGFFENKIYDTINPEKRILLSEEFLNEGNDVEISKALKEIIKLRYSENIVKGKTEYIDNFMKIWVDIAFDARETTSDKKAAKIRTKYLKKYADNPIIKLRDLGDVYQKLMYFEFRHLCRVYIYSCTESKSYSRYFDIIPIKQSKLYYMIESDLQRIGITFATRFGFDELAPELISATEDELDAFRERAENKSII